MQVKQAPVGGNAFLLYCLHIITEIRGDMMLKSRFWFLLLFISGFSRAVWADDAGGQGIFSFSEWRLAVYAGRYDVDDEPQFIGVRNKYGFGVGLSGVLREYPNLALDFEIQSVNRDYDTPLGPPLWGVIDNDTSVQTSALLVGARAFYPSSGRLNAYISAGMGLFYTRMVVTGSVFGFPGLYEDTDTSLEPYYGLGLSLSFDNWGLSLDMRHFDLKGDFSAFNVSNANLGGDMLLVGWHYKF